MSPRRALREPPPAGERAAIVTLLGQVLLSMGDAEAIPLLSQGLAETPDGPAHAGLAEALALALHYQGRMVEAVAALDGARDRLAGPHPELAEELDATALHYLFFDPALPPQRGERLARLGDRPGVSTTPSSPTSTRSPARRSRAW
jgi:hypothetical protein